LLQNIYDYEDGIAKVRWEVYPDGMYYRVTSYFLFTERKEEKGSYSAQESTQEQRRCCFEDFFVHIDRFSAKDSYLCRIIPTAGLPLAGQL
jgi:hypothetical protein